MAEQTGTPCVWDGVPEDEHGTRYAAGIGLHEFWFDWTRPAKARPQLLQVRRAEADALAAAAKPGRVVSVEPVRTPVDEAPEQIEVAAESRAEITFTLVDHRPAPAPWWRRIRGSRT